MGLSLLVKIMGDGKSYAGALEGAKVQTEKFKKEVGQLSQGPLKDLKGNLFAAFSVGGILAAIKSTVDYASHLQDLSDQLDISTDALQEFGYSAKLSGSNEDAVAKFFEHIATARQDAINGNEQAIKSFEKLGVTLDDLTSKRLEDIGKQIGKGLNSKDIQSVIADLRNIGGKGVVSLIPALQGLEENAAALRGIGGLLETKLIGQIDTIGDKWTAIATQLRGPLATAIGFFGDRVSEVIDLFKVIGAGAGGFFGAIAGGDKTFNGPIEAAAKAQRKVIDERIKAQRALDAAAKARDESRGKAPDIEADGKVEQEIQDRKISSEEKLSEIRRKNNLDMLDDERKLQALMAERNKLVNGPISLNTEGMIHAEELRGQINAMLRGQRASPQNFDSLARIGGFAQGADQGLKSIGEKQLRAQLQIVDNTKPWPGDGIVRGTP